ASQPLSSWLSSSPHRSRACSRVSQVSTPLPTGVLASRATLVSPAVTASQTYSKCGVPPRITAPRQAAASYAVASSAATTGSSTAPATRTTSGSAIPQARAAAQARRTRLSVISACQRVATMARVSPAASTVVPVGRPVPLTAPPRGWRGRRRSVPTARRSGGRGGPACGEVAHVFPRRLDRQRDHAGHLDAAGGQPGHLRRVVREQPYRAHPEVGENLRADG